MGRGVRAAGVLAAGSYAYAGMWPASQIFGRLRRGSKGPPADRPDL